MTRMDGMSKKWQDDKKWGFTKENKDNWTGKLGKRRNPGPSSGVPGLSFIHATVCVTLSFISTVPGFLFLPVRIIWGHCGYQYA